MRTDRDALEDIVERCERLRSMVAQGHDAFDADLALGDAVASLSSDIKARHPDVPWKEIVGMRNRLIHAYFGTSPDIVWTVASEFAPRLETRSREILAEFSR